jgi:hypothetical protein
MTDPMQKLPKGHEEPHTEKKVGITISVEATPEFYEAMDQLRLKMAGIVKRQVENELNRALGLPYEVEANGQKYRIEKDEDGEFYTPIEEG